MRKAVSESRERTFDHDVADRAQLEAAIERMAAELCMSLERHERRGRTIAIKVRLDDFSTVTRARTIEPAHVRRARVGAGGGGAPAPLFAAPPGAAAGCAGGGLRRSSHASDAVAREHERTGCRPAQLALPLGRQ